MREGVKIPRFLLRVTKSYLQTNPSCSCSSEQLRTNSLWITSLTAINNRITSNNQDNKRRNARLTFTYVAPSVHWMPALGLGKYCWIAFKTSFTINTRKFHNCFHLFSEMLSIALNSIRGITDIASNVVCARPVTVATRTLTVAIPFIVSVNQESL